ncbi:hypothetical protein Q5P01_023675 [Channa striata]|uniref:Gastric inhibitory polypeptide n=1 Tax=Channa striata TaxID=64152 RepID=A0AA88LR19_CHASR|nr:hypothetical protein Q5P01_023675 [Channa striata]
MSCVLKVLISRQTEEGDRGLRFIMKVLLFELLLLCMFGALHAGANTQPEHMSEDEQLVGRRYAESTIASEISKIMESMFQKNFVDFLLNQKSRRSKPVKEERQYNDFLKLSLQEKQKGEFFISNNLPLIQCHKIINICQN